MILADKICMLRKKNGWSQEEFAQKLNVTRQAVSKWEGAQTIPDLEKVLQMSRLFGVSTDYLIKEEMEIEEYVGEEEAEQTLHKVSLEEANTFLERKAQTAKATAFGVFLCIISPIVLIILAAVSATYPECVSEDAAGGIGTIILLILVAAASAIFVHCGMKTKRFDYLNTEKIDTEYGVRGMVKERCKQYHNTYERSNIIGTVLCIISLVLAFYLGYSFITNDWWRSWIVWPVAAVLYGAVVALVKACSRKEK